MRRMTRREALKKIGCATAAFAADFPMRSLSPLLAADGQVTESERAAMAELAAAFMGQFAVPALSIAIARNGRIVYEGPFGRVGSDTDEPLRASNLFRIASVTKPITSAAIFSLVEKGQIALSDTVFEQGGILGTEYGTSPYRRYVAQITVDHLLTHSCGGWQNDSSDPIFRFREMNHAQLISWTLDDLPLLDPPGEHYAYSNFGY